MAQRITVGPISLVAVCQLILCVGGALRGDALGAAPNGVAAVLGLAVAECLSPTLCVLYIIACVAELGNDAIRSWSLSLFGIAHSPFRVERPAVFIASFLAMAGMMLAARLFFSIRDCECSAGERIPLVAKAPGNHSADESSGAARTLVGRAFPGEKASLATRTQAERAKAAQPPADIESHSTRGAADDAAGGARPAADSPRAAAPFQAIFQATIPRSPRVPPSKMQPTCAKEIGDVV